MAETRRPNLVFIMPDQLRADFLSCYGANFISTPGIDRLANSGVRYTNALSAHPVCVPARTSLLVGMHALRTGVLDNPAFIPPNYHFFGLRTWPELLVENGYRTAAIGKMHFYPWDARLGFQYRRIAEDKRWLHIRDDYWHFLRKQGERKHHVREHAGFQENRGAVINILPWELQVDHWVGQQACEFIRSQGSEEPFALMVGFPGPHDPYDPAPEFLEGLRPEDMPEPAPDAGDTPRLRAQNVAGNRGPSLGIDFSEFTRDHMLKIRAHYAALVRQIDKEVGEILTAIDDCGLSDNTVIIFSSDHGDALGDHGLIGKAFFFESAMHVPLIVSARWLDKAKACEEMVQLTDVTATLLGLAGMNIPSWMDATPLPGLGIGEAKPRGPLVGALAGSWMIQDGALRLSRYANGEAMLFDLSIDPDEQHNLIEDPGYQAAVRDLDSKLAADIMNRIVRSHGALTVERNLSQSREFGFEGWERPYPGRYTERGY